MEIFGTSIISIVGYLVVALGALTLILTLIGIFLVYHFWRTRKVIIPTVALAIISSLEVPIKRLSWILGVDPEVVDRAIVQLRNTLYHRAYIKTPYSQRAIFLPQCLRHPQCPARLSPEGLECINCGRCGLGKIKELAEHLGCLFFIAPGGSLVKRMVKKYKPKAVLGVGCSLEVKEGSGLMEALNIPVQAVTLEYDGCVDTRVNVEELLRKIAETEEGVPDYISIKASEISKCWPLKLPVEEGEVKIRETKLGKWLR